MGNVPGGGNNDGSDNNHRPNYRRMQKFRTENRISRGRNIGFADYDINGESGSQFAISKGDFPGTASTTTNRLFDVLETNQGDPYRDSENKILEWLGSKYQFNPNIEGTVDLYTERKPCRSCASIIDQFREMFPNITVNVTYGPFDTVWIRE